MVNKNGEGGHSCLVSDLRGIVFSFQLFTLDYDANCEFVMYRFYYSEVHCFYGLPQWLSSKESSCNAGAVETQVQSQGQEDPLEKGMATHSSILT